MTWTDKLNHKHSSTSSTELCITLTFAPDFFTLFVVLHCFGILEILIILGQCIKNAHNIYIILCENVCEALILI